MKCPACGAVIPAKERIDWQALAARHGFESVAGMLRELYRERSLDEVADLLRLSRFAVRQKMVQMNLPRRRPWDPVERRP